MSKNKKHKNSNYKTNKAKPVAKTKHDTAEKKTTQPITIVLIVAVLLVAIVGSLFMFTDVFSFKQPTAPTVPLEENPAGNDVEDITKWLNEKYGLEFNHEFTSAGASVFSADGLAGMVQVFRREVVQEFDTSIDHLFTDIYADNGYAIVNMQKSVDYYKNFITIDLGNHTCMTYVDIIANPSKVNVNTPYEQYLDIIAELTIPEFIILTDKELSDEEKAQLGEEMKAIGKPVAVRVFTLEASQQSLVTPGDIMQLGSGHKYVQYREIFNADHLLEE